jgi:hypothetical protein
MTRAKKIDTFWMVEAPQGKFQDPITWSSKIPAGTSKGMVDKKKVKISCF